MASYTLPMMNYYSSIVRTDLDGELSFPEEREGSG